MVNYNTLNPTRYDQSSPYRPTETSKSVERSLEPSSGVATDDPSKKLAGSVDLAQARAGGSDKLPEPGAQGGCPSCGGNCSCGGAGCSGCGCTGCGNNNSKESVASNNDWSGARSASEANA